MTTTTGLKTERTTLKRLPERGSHEIETIYAILDEGLYCHVGFVAEGQPFVVPTAYGRDGNAVFIHGSSASRMLRTLAGGVDMCVTVTLADGLVLARSAFHHSINYRSVMIVGVAQLVPDDEKMHGLKVVTERLVPGRWADVRPPSSQELKATAVLKLDIEEASAKVRSGGPKDDEADMSLDCWAGVLPIGLRPGAPVADNGVAANLPDYVTNYQRPRANGQGNDA